MSASLSLLNFLEFDRLLSLRACSSVIRRILSSLRYFSGKGPQLVLFYLLRLGGSHRNKAIYAAKVPYRTKAELNRPSRRAVSLRR